MRSSFSLVSLSFALVGVFFLSEGVNGLDLIKGTCRRIAKTNPKLYYPDCVRSFYANTQSKNADLAGLGVISTELAMSNAKFAKLYAKNVLKAEQNATHVKPLKECLEGYADVIPQLQEVKDAFLAKDYATANTKMSAAMDSASDCQDGLAESGVTVTSLTKKNNDFAQLASITLAISNMVLNP